MAHVENLGLTIVWLVCTTH